MNFKKLVSVAALGLGLTLGAVSAQSAVLSFEDDDIDFVLRPTTVGGVTTYTVLTSGTISQGDILVSVLEVPTFTIDGVNAIPTGQELTGVAAVQITSITGTGVGSTFTFSAVDGGLNSILALGTDPDATVVQGGAGEDATLALFLNSTSGAGGDINLDLSRSTLIPQGSTNCTSLANCIDQASLGSLFQVDGLGGDADAFQTSTQILAGGGDIATVLGTANNALIAGFNFALNTFFNASGPIGFIDIATGVPCPAGTTGADGCIAGLVGSGTITGGQGLSNGAIAHSDFDAQKLQVPEPGTLALLAVGLLGAGVGFSRRKA